ncbi:hypothetical protein CSUB_C1199 [Candidatus Caldarchaeum subterraneum]|uniref:Uncharacterized protein n=2 Tax=Thermoproteati TaxID=1783275 RepID=H5SGG5_9CREN|nr:hypothetical protein HGMM_F29F10C26 [Candidatus Caldarchaeum subterraneum]BAJ51051.1 hypothetical protein CSUB_C1199 [Candidatus Caldarchaeum subterraneum]BAL55251.1 hypothetical protein HGMM_F25A04C37 [uncultured crenarchaeote]
MLDILVNDFIKFFSSDLSTRLKEIVDERRKICKQVLSEENIDSAKAEDLELVFNNFLTGDFDKGFKAAVEKYSYRNLVEHLKYFLYGSDTLEQRFDRFFLAIPELPQLAVMEVATFAQPKSFCIWDVSAKSTIRYIGHSRMHGLSEDSFKDFIAGLDYVWAKLALNHVRQILSAYSGRKTDFVDVYIFTRYVYEEWILKKSFSDG